jgi:uncharacterized membrane protein
MSHVHHGARLRASSAHLPKLLPTVALLWGALLASPAAQAQSAYTLTVLKAPGSKPIFPTVIDPQNRVLGTTDYLSGWGLVPNLSGFGWLYTTYAIRWPASTAATVSAVKLVSKQGGGLRAASADGNKIVLAMGLALVYDANTATQLSTLTYPAVAGGNGNISGANVAGISNAGKMVLNYSEGADRFAGARSGLWTADPDGVQLPLGSYQGSTAVSINGAGQVAGLVYEGALPNRRAALWANGALQVIDQTPDRGSAAVAANANGQVLVRTNALTVKRFDDGAGGFFQQAVYAAPSYLLYANGVERPIRALAAGEAVVANGLNAAGAVVGRMGQAANIDRTSSYSGEAPERGPGIDFNTGRAFIWREGVTTDLTTLVASKGAKLPTGAVLSDAIAINDQGSILARMRDAKGVMSYVRLTAKP